MNGESTSLTVDGGGRRKDMATVSTPSNPTFANDKTTDHQHAITWRGQKVPFEKEEEILHIRIRWIVCCFVRINKSVVFLYPSLNILCIDPPQQLYRGGACKHHHSILHQYVGVDIIIDPSSVVSSI